jgi:hypothetical protein
LFGGAERAFSFPADYPLSRWRHITIGDGASASFALGKLKPNFSEVDMSNRILIAAVSAILLASIGLASAQQGRAHWQVSNAYGYAPHDASYYNKGYWDAVAPNIHVRPDPYVGTVRENVAP